MITECFNGAVTFLLYLLQVILSMEDDGFVLVKPSKRTFKQKKKHSKAGETHELLSNDEISETVQ